MRPLSCLDVAEARTLIGAIDELTRKKLDHVIGTLVKLVKPGR